VSAPPKTKLVLRPRRVTPTDLRWAERADDLQFEALSLVRAAAEKWAASLLAILGLTGTVLVVKGREDLTELDLLYQVVVAVLLLLGVGAAAVATFLAARAAQGTPEEVKWPSGAKLRRWEHDQARKARRKLMWSRRVTLMAVAFIVLAVGVTWFGEGGESAASASAIVQTADGVTVCGKLAKAAGPGNVRLAVRDGDSTTHVQMGGARSIVSVTACPKEP
jgi:hypothetical protein